MDKGNSLSLPTAINARQHLDTKKKSDTRNVHPGYSMFEWNVLCDSGQDLSGVGGKLRKVTLEELKKHSSDKDAWTAVRGKVYNITHFLKFHPGGKAQLMRGAGIDCTELYDKIHVWVSSESILEKCLVGVLDAPMSPPKKSSQTLSVGGLSPATSGPPVKAAAELTFTVPTMSVPQSTQNEENLLSLQMLKQARIQSKESEEEEESIQVPVWIKPSEQTTSVSGASTNDDQGSSVDPPPAVSLKLKGYETSV